MSDDLVALQWEGGIGCEQGEDRAASRGMNGLLVKYDEALSSATLVVVQGGGPHKEWAKG